MKETENTIDFVMPWVDGQDPLWRQEKAKYTSGDGEDDREERYRSWDNLQYWFRGVEKYAPWVRKIHFITWGHLPKWLNTQHPKLHIVKHEDFIPREYLPTFNVNVIELNMHRIPGLARQFVYFNDDIFILKALREEDFFREGKPCDMLAFQPVVANPESPVMSHIFLNNTLLLAKYFKKRENVKMQPQNYFKPGYPLLYFGYNLLELLFPLFTGFYTVHGAAAFRRETFETVWGKEPEPLLATSAHRFRSPEDNSQYLMREWQKLSGEFSAQNVHRYNRYFNVGDSNRKLLKTIEARASKIVCINDSHKVTDFNQVKDEINRTLGRILPEKSGFER